MAKNRRGISDPTETGSTVRVDRNGQPLTRTNLWLRDDIHRRVERLALQEQRTMSSMLRVLIAEGLKKTSAPKQSRRQKLAPRGDEEPSNGRKQTHLES